jgi:hypothetical protein
MRHQFNLTATLLAALWLALALLVSPMAHGDQLRPQFDHLTTGFELTGQHRDLPCEQCHANGLFKGTPRECSACHGLGTTVRATAKSANHILSSEQCDSCHATVAWVPAVNFDHAQTHGSCLTCHNNVQAQGKGPQHISTDLECDVCHTTISWSGARFNHEGISGGCAQCHNGVTASGMPSNHIPTAGAPCESCHSPTSFTTFAGASMNHSAVAGLPCASCHEAGKSFIGTTITTRPPPPHPATGDCSNCHSSTSSFGGLADLPPNHIPTAQACSLCHANQADFSIYAMNHQGISSGCATCHGAGLSFANMAPPVLKEIPANHIPTGSQACEGCHSTTNFTSFAGTAMSHSVVAGTPCSACHEAGKSFVGSPPIITRPPPPHAATGECSTCHFSTTTFAGALVMPANHIPLPAADGSNCSLCHTNANDYSIYTMNHNGISSNCAQCHGAGLSFANMAPPVLKEIPANHIPVGSLSCESCHSKSNFTSFAGTPMNHPAVAGTPCSTCHEAGRSFAGSPPIVTRPPAPHVATGECSNCHFSTTTFSGALSMPSNHIPLPASDGGNCALCHTNPNDYSVYTMNHNGISNNCAQCHGSGLMFANIGPPALKQPPTGPPRHIPTGSVACELCHLPTNFTSFAGTTIRHAAVAGQRCDSCHELGMSWYGISHLWVRDGPNHHKGQDCGGSGCHSPRDRSGGNTAAAVRARVRGQPQSTRVQAQALSVPPGRLQAQALNMPPSRARTAEPNTAAAISAWASRVAGGGQFTHPAVVGRCVSCHTSSTRPLSKLHVATTTSCESCHNTLAWLPVRRVDHTQVKGPCATCHNGLLASGMSHRHVAVARNCDSCHTTNGWTPARFDHTAGAQRACASCHDSIHAVGLPRNHIPSTKSCDSCHGTLAWKPVRLDHSTLTTACATCHNNSGAIGKTSSHMTTALDCATCHTYPDWSAVSFRHTTPQYPGEHHTKLSCNQCHRTNTEQVVYTAPAQAGKCASCHVQDFKADAHQMTQKGQLYTADALADCTGACHVYSDVTRATITKSVRGPHHRVTDATFHH